jgi:ubiquinone/menaquinone biosynthesis C-methylase UbiE
MDVALQSDNEQVALWNGLAGRAWIEMQGLLERVFKPFEELLVEAVSRAPGSRALDVGCGTGGTTLAIARLLGEKGRSVGIDISDAMIAAAQSRSKRESTPASFICADAQRYAFERASFDRIISRFGVMFFDDPVRAFVNLRRAAANNAVLRFIAWRSAAENPFMTTAERAAAPLLPNLSARQLDAPGQFAFASDRWVYTILEESGWGEIDVRPIDIACTLPEKELIPYLTRLGPVGRILQEADHRTRAQVIETVRPAFDPYIAGADVRFTAACWMVSAQARSASAAPNDVFNESRRGEIQETHHEPDPKSVSPEETPEVQGETV